MTLVEQAIERLRRLPPNRQEQAARFVLHELDADDRWGRTTGEHGEAADRLVTDILAADADGLTEPLDVDRL